MFARLPRPRRPGLLRRTCLLVCAANNVAIASYPSLFAAVVSVAAHDVRDPAVWFYNPQPAGRVRRVRPRRRRRLEGTAAGSSRPATASRRRTSPGYAARIRAAHPGASPFEVKTILAATADSRLSPAGQRNAPSARPAGRSCSREVVALRRPLGGPRRRSRRSARRRVDGRRGAKSPPVPGVDRQAVVVG